MAQTDTGRASALPLGSTDWQTVLDNAAYVPVPYLPSFVRYQQAYFRGKGDDVRDGSQVFYQDNRPVAVWPMCQRDGCTTTNGSDLLPPLFVADLPEKVQKRIVADCLRQVDLGRGAFAEEIAMFGLSLWHRRVLEAGGKAYPHSVELFVDLSLPAEAVWAQMRKSYRSLVRQAQKRYDTILGVNVRPLQRLHLLDAGGVTRSEETWDLQQAAIEAGEAFCVYVLDGEETVAGALFHRSRDEALYAVAAENPDRHGEPFGHLVQVFAIDHLRRLGVRWYHLGTRCYEGVSDKEMQIAHFKEGFATHTFPRVTALLMR